MASFIPRDCIPIIQSYLKASDFAVSRLVSKDFVQKHAVCQQTVTYTSQKPIPSCWIKVRVGDQMREEILRQAVHLRKLSFKEVGLIGDEGVETLVNLENLDVENSVVTDDAMCKLEKLTCLKIPSASGVSDRGIKGLTKIKILWLGLLSIVTDEGIEGMEKMKMFGNDRITDYGIRKMKNLEILSCPFKNVNFTGRGIKHLVHLKTLKISSKLDASSLNHLSQLKVLKCCEIDDLEKLSLPKLESLHLSKQSSCPGLNKLTSLKYLSLPRSQLYDHDLEPLVDLQTLKLGTFCQNVTDKAIENMNTLKTLLLRNSSITGSGLRKLPQLRSLSLGHAKFTNQDLEGLNLTYLSLGHCLDITNECPLVHSVETLYTGRNQSVSRSNPGN